MQQGTGIVSFSSGGILISCPITISKTMARAIAKREGASMGQGQMRSAACTVSRGAESATVTPLGQHELLYEGFTGTLPEITGIFLRERRAGFLIGITLNPLLRAGCLFEGELESTMTVGFGIEIGEIHYNPRQSIPLARELAGNLVRCPANIELMGALTLGLAIPIRLV